MDDMERVGHELGRVIDIALEVHEGRPLLENAGIEAFLYGFGHSVHVGVALADVHVVADADDVRHEGNHICRLADCFAVSDLGLLFVEILHLKAEQVAGGGEREACSCRIVAENADAETRIKDLCRDVAAAKIAQRVGDSPYSLDLIIGLLPCEEEVVHVHVFCVKFSESFNHSVKIFDRILHMMPPDSVLSQWGKPPASIS